jgi:hypothetical protein
VRVRMATPEGGTSMPDKVTPVTRMRNPHL